MNTYHILYSEHMWWKKENGHQLGVKEGYGNSTSNELSVDK